MKADNEQLAVIQAYALELTRRLESQRRKGTAGNCLCEPILECELGGFESTPLLGWMYFNPFGPTMAALFHIPIPGSERGLLTYRYDNPFERQHAAFGLIPNAATMEELGDTVHHLFVANGSDSCPIFESLPTSIFHCRNWPVDRLEPLFRPDLARKLFAEVAFHTWPEDMDSICQNLRLHSDPWERAQAELQESTGLVMAQSDPLNSGFRREEFDDWFDLVTEPKHVKAERANFAAAWQAAMNQR